MKAEIPVVIPGAILYVIPEVIPLAIPVVAIFRNLWIHSIVLLILLLKWSPPQKMYAMLSHPRRIVAMLSLPQRMLVMLSHPRRIVAMLSLPQRMLAMLSRP